MKTIVSGLLLALALGATPFTAALAQGPGHGEYEQCYATGTHMPTAAQNISGVVVKFCSL